LAVVGWELYLISNVTCIPDFKSTPKMFTDSQIICQMDIPTHQSTSDQIIS
jgi:hypothetical protein